MSLDATVYCNCVREGKLKTPPPYPELLHVEKETGQPFVDSDNLEVCMEHDKWMKNDACEHPHCIYISIRLGNIALIGWLRQLVERAVIQGESLEILQNHIVISGSGGSSPVPYKLVNQLSDELERFRKVAKSYELSADERGLLEGFLENIEVLCQGALKTKNPIELL